MLNGNGARAMPGSILAPNSGSYCRKIRKIQVAKWGSLKEDAFMK
jgi:hypothetical protein